jgi:hypothetical protein
MVDMAFHGKDFNFKFLAYLPCQLLESLLDMRNQEYLATVFGTEYKMIVDERYCCFCPEIFIFHDINITR